MTPKTRYQHDLKREDFVHDPAQEKAVALLQDLYQRLLDKPGISFLRRLNPFSSRTTEPVRGLYFWGGVGRGKTYLMDIFYDCLPFQEKSRLHFNHFTQRVHQDLTELKGEKNPLEKVADKLSRENRIICFDEFFVSDITDAMILSRLFEQLFKRGVILVATSNVEPDNLYKDGLQRTRFLPAIDLLKQHTLVVNIDGGIDYRLRLLEQAETYHFPLSESTHERLTEAFATLAADFYQATGNQSVRVAGRDIPCVHNCEDLAWFTFSALCDGPRSQNDYIELGCLFQTVILEGVPQMDASKDDQARRFINLIDEFYDRNVKLIISAQVALSELYISGRLEFEFQRTRSRLQEMQSREYLTRPHRAIIT